MKKFFVAFLSILSVFCVLLILPAGCADKTYQKSKSYYEINTEDPVWKTYQSTAAMRAAVHLDEEVLKDKSTEEVLRATLEYPLIGDLFAFSTTELAVSQVSEHCTALRILLEREDAYACLTDFYNTKETSVYKVQAPQSQRDIAPYVVEELLDYLGNETDT